MQSITNQFDASVDQTEQDVAKKCGTEKTRAEWQKTKPN